jgi:hypothetical protein
MGGADSSLLVRKRLTPFILFMLGAQDPSLEGHHADRHLITQMKKLIKIVSIFLVFYVKVSSKNPPVINEAFSSELYRTSHEDNCNFLAARGVGASTIVYVLYALSCWTGVSVAGTTKLEMGPSASRTINELKLLVLIIGQDNDEANYNSTAPYAYTKGSDRDESDALRIMQVPGVDLDQHHASNQALLRSIEAGGLFAGNSGEGSIPHDFDVTVRGAHGNKPIFFYTEPICFNEAWTDSK